MPELFLGVPTIKTKVQASIDEYGADYTDGDTGDLLVYEVIWTPLFLGTATCPANAEGCPEGEEYIYTSIEFEFQVFGGVTETPTFTGDMSSLTSPGDVAWFSEQNATVVGIKLTNPQTVSYNNPSLPVVKYIAIYATGLTSSYGAASSYVVGRFHLQIAAGNEGSNITTVIGASRRTLSMTSGSRNYMSALNPMDDNDVYTIPAAADTRVYVKNLNVNGLGEQYEAVSDTSPNNTGNVYLLELATGQIFNSDESGAVVAQYYSCGYSCSYVVTNPYWTLGSEVTGTDRPDNLYSPLTTVTEPVWALLDI